MNAEFDLAVVGSGLTGLASARLLALRGFRVVHFRPKAFKDTRTSALMMSSVNFMIETGLIAKNDIHIGTALKSIRIIDATNRLFRSPEVLFRSNEIDLDAFGYNFPNATLLKQFSQLPSPLLEVSQPVTKISRIEDGYSIQTGDGRRLTTSGIIAADGRNSLVRDCLGLVARRHAHEQAALVAESMFESPEPETSVEFHYENGPFTLVPAGGKKVNLVWIDRHDVLQQAQALSATERARLIEKKSRHLFGQATSPQKPVIFPLNSLRVPHVGYNGVFLVGEAAHAFPPIGAQGLNLGLRDVAQMVACLEKVEPGEGTSRFAAASRQYDHLRQPDLTKTGLFVDCLHHSLVSELLPAQCLRQSVLWAFKISPALRSAAMRLGTGLG